MGVFQQPVKGIQTLPMGRLTPMLDWMGCHPLNIFVRNEGVVRKLLLVSPSHQFRKKLRAIKIPQLSLHILASLTPNDVDITVVDEEIREIDFSLDFDLVGI